MAIIIKIIYKMIKLIVRKAEIERFFFTIILEASSILHFLMLTGKLFHRVAAAE